MIRYATYQKGDKVSAETYRVDSSGGWLFVHGVVVSDEGGRELVIKASEDSNFAGEEMTVYKDRLF